MTSFFSTLKTSNTECQRKAESLETLSKNISAHDTSSFDSLAGNFDLKFFLILTRLNHAIMRFSSPSFVLNYFSRFFISYDDGKCFSSVELHSFSSVFGGQVWISHSYKLYYQ